MARTRRHVIVGNSAAGLSAVKAIRKTGDGGAITLISAEDRPAYSPVLTTYYIGGEIEKSGLFLVDERFYRTMKVETLLGRRTVEIDPARKLVRLDNRMKVPYDDLLIATGASARTLDQADLEAKPLVSTLRTIDDAEKIKKFRVKAKEIVIIGAGLVSLQTIKALLRKGLKITVLAGSYQVLSQQMDAESAAFIQKRLEEEGVTLLFGRRVKGVHRKGDQARVVTNYNEVLPADLVFVGRGVRPNTQLAESAGLEVHDGVIVDDRMRTNREDIYAAGDVAEGRNSLTSRREVFATWFNACAQGEVAGLNMAGRPARRLSQFRENVTTILGVVAASLGLSRAGGGEFEEIRYINEKKGIYRKLLFQERTLIGALLLGRIEDAGVIRQCIADRLDVSPWLNRIAAAPLDFGSIIGGRYPAWPMLSA